MRFALLIVGAVLAAGCDKVSVPDVGLEASSTNAAAFHLRDFSLKEEKESYGTTYSGRVTIVATSEALKTGTYLVFLEARAEHDVDQIDHVSVLVRDGLGEVTVGDFQGKDEG